MTTVLYLQLAHSAQHTRLLEGAMTYARNTGTRFQLVECWRKAKAGVKPAKDEYAKLVQLHHATVVIVVGSPEIDLSDLDFGETPVVYLDCYPFKLAKRRKGAFVFNDDAAIAETAIKELLQRPLNSLAYVAFPEKIAWSSGRQRSFTEFADLNGLKSAVFEKPNLLSNEDVALEKFLKSLPKPCGIFAANDYVARHVIFQCERIGLSVPEEVSVIGVDNERSCCEGSLITLSSVECDFFLGGYLATRTAVQLAESADGSATNVVFPPTGVVPRRSTRIFTRHDTRVEQALDYIHFHATERIDVSDVAEQMGLARRQAEVLFRTVSGRSILDEIRETRIRQAMRLLRDPTKRMSEVAHDCGYNSPEALRKAFESVHGESLAAWRKKLSS